MKNERRFRTFEEYHLEKLQDPEDALGYLMVVLDEFARDHDVESLIYSLQTIAKAQGIKLDELDTQELETELSNNSVMGWGLLDALAALFDLNFNITFVESLPAFSN